MLGGCRGCWGPTPLADSEVLAPHAVGRPAVCPSVVREAHSALVRHGLRYFEAHHAERAGRHGLMWVALVDIFVLAHKSGGRRHR